MADASDDMEPRDEDRQALQALIRVWRTILIGAHKSWVLFEQGTCVILSSPTAEADLAGAAQTVLEAYGPVVPNSSATEFSVIPLADVAGWVVTGHHPDILNYVPPTVFTTATPPEVVVGMYGRTMRDADGLMPKVVHVEDRR